MPQIRIDAGYQKGTVYPLTDRAMIVGRAPDCDIHVDIDCPASRYHAELYRAGNGWRIKDLDSLNGTLVNKERIVDTELKPGDRFLIGDSIFIFETAERGLPPGRSGKIPFPVVTSPGIEPLRQRVTAMGRKTALIEREIAKAIVGHQGIVRELLAALLCDGHVLLTGHPGLAKTMLLRNLSEVLDLSFRRVALTPDLPPSGLVGAPALRGAAGGKEEGRFVRGPIFAQLVLADEINRTPSQTQAALLDAMHERGVTAAGEAFPLPPPFLVVASQSPLEQAGAHPLPPPQLDRFMLNLHLEHPSEKEEEKIAVVSGGAGMPGLQKILNVPEILELQAIVRDLPVPARVVKYATRLVRATRPGDARAPAFIEKWVQCGASPRASQHLVAAAKARAILEGRLAVETDDVRASALAVLRHRVIPNEMAELESMDGYKIVRMLLGTMPEPGEGEE